MKYTKGGLLTERKYKTDKGFFALIVSGDRGHIDFNEVASILGCNKVKLAGARDVEKVTGCAVGSIPIKSGGIQQLGELSFEACCEENIYRNVQ